MLNKARKSAEVRERNRVGRKPANHHVFHSKESTDTAKMKCVA